MAASTKTIPLLFLFSISETAAFKVVKSYIYKIQDAFAENQSYGYRNRYQYSNLNHFHAFFTL